MSRFHKRLDAPPLPATVEPRNPRLRPLHGQAASSEVPREGSPWQKMPSEPWNVFWTPLQPRQVVNINSVFSLAYDNTEGIKEIFKLEANPGTARVITYLSFHAVDGCNSEFAPFGLYGQVYFAVLTNDAALSQLKAYDTKSLDGGGLGQGIGQINGPLGHNLIPGVGTMSGVLTLNDQQNLSVCAYTQANLQDCGLQKLIVHLQGFEVDSQKYTEVAGASK